MTEKELQIKWHNYAKLNPRLSLDNGEVIRILFPGRFNENESGPDFLNAAIQFDECTLHGSIELHFKSSDWYAHGHHVDANYANVILHVVLNNNQPVQCLGNDILQFEVPQNHLWRRLNEQAEFSCPPCSTLTLRPTKRSVSTEKDEMLEFKLHQTIKQFSDEHRIDHQQVLYELLAIGFGMKVNKEAFWMLSKRLPYQFVKRRKPHQILDLLLFTAGFEMDTSDKKQHTEIRDLCRFYQVDKMDQFVWKFKGLRPNGFPNKRLAQFAQVLTKFIRVNQEAVVENLDKTWHQIVDGLPRQLSELLFINVYIPFQFWMVNEAGKDQKSGLIAIKQQLTNQKPENNQLMKRLKSCGFEVRNAMDSQALLSLYRTKCARKKCLNCNIGKELMRV